MGRRWAECGHGRLFQIALCGQGVDPQCRMGPLRDMLGCQHMQRAANPGPVFRPQGDLFATSEAADGMSLDSKSFPCLAMELEEQARALEGAWYACGRSVPGVLLAGATPPASAGGERGRHSGSITTSGSWGSCQGGMSHGPLPSASHRA